MRMGSRSTEEPLKRGDFLATKESTIASRRPSEPVWKGPAARPIRIVDGPDTQRLCEPELWTGAQLSRQLAKQSHRSEARRPAGHRGRRGRPPLQSGRSRRHPGCRPSAYHPRCGQRNDGWLPADRKRHHGRPGPRRPASSRRRNWLRAHLHRASKRPGSRHATVPPSMLLQVASLARDFSSPVVRLN